MISDGNAGEKMEGLRRHRDTAMGHELQRLGAAQRRGRQLRRSRRPALPNHPLAVAVVPLRGIAPGKRIRFNKGFQATAHKLSLCNGYSSLLRLFLQPVGRRLNPNVVRVNET